ncbi:MAG: OmpA family protein [Gammaproteobacteria bacterium]|nr:OmpA family protein [Gammaproteobacteria bacterium]
MSVAEAEAEAGGLPGWVMTFADLMTLLMCFYVLMLSFSEMDVAKFKELAGSVQNAFGVQNEIEVKTMPRGTSIIAREFSPGRPEPTAVNTVRQFTINSNMNTLDVGSAERLEELEELERKERMAQELAEALRQKLEDEIANGNLLVREEDSDVVIQILEQDSFASGEADVQADFVPALGSIGTVISDLPNAIIVSGHTDNIPISRGRFRSNWDLSAARAASVAHALLENGVDPQRIMITGHADTQPRADNDNPENRARNRRIDITLLPTQERHESWVGVAAASNEAAEVPVEP